MIKVKVFGVKWDTDGEHIEGLPADPVLEFDRDDIFDRKDQEEIEEIISDELSKQFGFLHDGFEGHEIINNTPTKSDISILWHKAISIYSGNFVEGYLHLGKDMPSIYKDGKVYYVSEKTICTYTGKDDVNSQKIFSGDLIEVSGTEELSEVIYAEESCGFAYVVPSGNTMYFWEGLLCEVKGNKFLDTDMLKETY